MFRPFIYLFNSLNSQINKTGFAKSLYSGLFQLLIITKTINTKLDHELSLMYNLINSN